MAIFQLACLLVVLILVRALIPITNKILRFAISAVLGTVFTVQFSSVILTGNVANYRFYENFSLTDATSVSAFFGAELLYIILALLIATWVIHAGSQWLRRKFSTKTIPVSTLVFGMIIMSLHGGIVHNAYDTLRLKFAGSASFEDALSALGIDPDDYISKSEIEAIPGKNIIVLSLESFEKGYLGQNLNHLTPNLSRLAQEGTLYDMQQSPAGGWTSASLYTFISGVPAFFGLHGNRVFQNNYDNKLTTLADVLINAGYDIQYFIGNKEYSGIDDMLKTFGFTVKSEKDFETKYEKLVWGIHDKDLFEEFKKELEKKKNSERPFAMFLSSISTHFPNGVLDKRLEEDLSPQPSNLEFMTLATDYMVGDLIAFLDKQGMLDNTVFYIFPDHLLMGKASRVISDFEERSLFLLTNADPKAISNPKDRPLTQIDLAKTILEGAKIKHNAKFLADFIADTDKNAFLNKHKANILRLNDAALKTFNCMDGLTIVIDKNSKTFTVNNSEGMSGTSGTLPTGPNCLRIMFDDMMRPINQLPVPFKDILKTFPDSPYLDIFTSKETTYASLKANPNFGITKKGDAKILFEKEDITVLKEIALAQHQDFIQVVSKSYNAKSQSSFSIGDKTTKISQRGLTVVIFNSQRKYELKTFDTYGSIEETTEFIDLLKKLNKNNVQYILFAHDSAHKALEAFSEDLDAMGLPGLRNLKTREAYIFYKIEGEVFEKTDALSVTVEIAYPKKVTNAELYFSRPTSDYLKDNNRFIAHAGGSINNLKYTDSKEALDLNYTKGFRLFELDISETKDGHFVATHDWKHWATQTNYKGELPVTRSEFLSHKIYGKYTPMDMDSINTWFAAHPDAVLVTDKINKPKEFSKQFVDKQRLLMELFTLEAVQEAANSGISTLISALPLSKIQGDKLSYLKEHNVAGVAVPRANIPAQKTLYETLAKNDIKVYVYQVNVEPGKDEKYVLENEIGIVYGMYADDWIFDPK
ncbi:MAG: sulfatase-like hydrolase/transferase [Flavobacteriaceae bacterium]